MKPAKTASPPTVAPAIVPTSEDGFGVDVGIEVGGGMALVTVDTWLGLVRGFDSCDVVWLALDSDVVGLVVNETELARVSPL
jgi:hypothetical protein